jgi:SAM-dependent methyltransferase
MMLENPKCPVCTGESFRTIGKKTYRKADMPKLSAYLQRKYTMLFGTWYKTQDVVEIRVILCLDCGLVFFAPRPTDAEVTAKYEFALTLGRHDRARDVDDARDQLRARCLQERLRPYLKTSGRVLDLGGGDGRLIRKLADEGQECCVVDFIKDPVPGVKRLGATIMELDPMERFDCIVLSHVLEHVAEPAALIERLASFQASDGIVYLEVPMELFRQVPPRLEPVTHINFFSPPCLGYIMERSGYRVLINELGWHDESDTLVVRTIAERTQEAASPLKPGSAFTESMLNPGLPEKLSVAALDMKRSLHIGKNLLKHRIKRVLQR